MQISGGNLERGEQDKSKKLTKILLISIVIIFILMIAILGLIIYLQKSVFHVYIDGVSVNLPEETILIDKETGKVQVDIMGIAKYLGYDAHKGEYKLYTEDANKCWVDSKNETASFFLNSNKISKMPPDQTKDYEDYTITEPVVSKNGKLYCSPEGIKIGFNVLFDYNAQNNSVQIHTLPYLVQQYSATFKQYGYSSLSTDFNNQKAILYNLFIVKKDNNLYGVVDSQNKEIVSSKYSKMEFNENAREFYVTNTISKKGIVTEKGVTKINLLYDEITMIDKLNGLYMVKSNGKYGVLGNQGNIVIHLEYDQIGVDIARFPNNNINNKYVLFENAIPVYQNKKWGMFDVKGNLILPVEFDEMGYSSGAVGNLSGKVVNNLLIVPSYKAIIIGKNMAAGQKTENKYGIYDYQGKELIVTALDNAYFVTNAGVNTYYMEYMGSTLNIEEYLEKHTTNSSNSNTNTNTQTNTTNTNTQTNNINQ